MTIRILNHVSALALGVALALPLAACNNTLRELQHFPELFNPKVNVTEYNYSAADDLVGQARGNLPLSTPIGIGVLYPTNLKPHEKTPPFGQVSTEQIATRFVNLGYNIRDMGISLQESANLSERTWLERANTNGAVVILIGNYTVSDYDVLINVRLVDVKGGRVIAATNYRVPLGSDTYQLLNRDPFQAWVSAPVNNPDAALPGTPLPSHDLPVRIMND